MYLQSPEVREEYEGHAASWLGPRPPGEQTCCRILGYPTLPVDPVWLHQPFHHGVLLVVPTVTFSREKDKDPAGDNLLA